MQTVQTVTGPCPAGELGRTLMHEHLVIGWPGWEAHLGDDRAARADRRTICVERMHELRELGVRTLLDPCPIDLGRDVELAAEVAAASGVRIVCATGLYKEDEGAPAYFRFRGQFADAGAEMADLFVRELTEGIGGTGIRAGVIKVATGAGRITPYEETVLRAAARAHKATGAPITTHTERGTMGVEQLAILSEEGVAASAVVVGHSCGSSDLAYHLAMLDRGAYLGFDRFGLELLHPDRERIAALIALLGVGFASRIVLSHDSVWCWRGRAFEVPPGVLADWEPTHLFRRIIPRLLEAGVREEEIEIMLAENPRRYFAEAGTTRC
jgi:phosphotriesterase-related protein